MTRCIQKQLIDRVHEDLSEISPDMEGGTWDEWTWEGGTFGGGQPT